MFPRDTFEGFQFPAFGQGVAMGPDVITNYHVEYLDPTSFASTNPRPIPHWSKLHLYRGSDRTWFNEWKAGIPSVGCGCQKGFADIEAELPAIFDDDVAFFERGIEWHNAVNEKLGYPTISMEQAYTLWRNVRPTTGRQRLVITVATGKPFRNLLDVTRASIALYARRCDADYIELTNETENWWGFEKFRVRHFAEQYDETLFVDADCVINPQAPSCFGLDAPLWIHDDWDYLKTTDWINKERDEIERTLGITMERRDTCLNTGVVYVKRSAADFWTRPGDSMVTSHTAEQLFAEQSAYRIEIGRAHV